MIDYQYWVNKEKYLRDDCSINYTDELTKNNNLFINSLGKIKTYNSNINKIELNDIIFEADE